MNAITLDFIDLGIASALIVLTGTVSFVLRLGLERQLAVAAVRTVVQLLLVGYVLNWVFGLDNPWAVGGLALIMVAAASRAAVQRPRHTFTGITGRAFLSLAASGLLTTLMVTTVIIKVEPWYRPQYVIPLLGMILGNGLTGLSLCLDQLLETFAERRARVELELALGATRWEAARGPVADGVRRGMIPIINSMMVVGIVSLPGMMTGQILAGENPLNAVKYQIVVMFMIAASAAFSSLFMGWFVFRSAFNPRHQLRPVVRRR